MFIVLIFTANTVISVFLIQVFYHSGKTLYFIKITVIYGSSNSKVTAPLLQYFFNVYAFFIFR